MPIQKEIYKVAVQSTVRAWRNRFERYALTGSKCPKCGQIYYPKRRVCAECHSREIEETILARQGTIESLAIDYLPVMGNMECLPIIRAIIKLDNGPSVFADVVDCSEDQAAIGMRVEMVIRRVKRESNGNLQYAHKWRLL